MCIHRNAHTHTRKDLYVCTRLCEYIGYTHIYVCMQACVHVLTAPSKLHSEPSTLAHTYVG